MQNDKNYKEVKKIEDLQTKIILSIIVTITIFIIIGIFMIKSFFTKREYFILNIDDKNRDKVIELFNNEKENIFYNKNYCESIYKIEYYYLFPDGTEYRMYCKDEDDITFSIDKVGDDTLADYIQKHGKIKIK